MPFKRPTLTEIRERNKNYFETQLDSVGKLLRFSNMRVLADAQAGMDHLHYGYLDYIALQATPATATDEYLAAWGSLKRIYRKPSGAAICAEVKFTGEAGSVIAGNAILTRSDGYQYKLDNRIVIAPEGFEIGSITAILPDPVDGVGGGALGNAPKGTFLTLDIDYVGVTSKAELLIAAMGGVDTESEESFRSRILYAYQNPPQGGSEADYIQWAKEVPAVTRAWAARHLVGAGTVGVYIMSDGGEVGNEGGFPNGTDGISPKESWGVIKATGLQAVVADYIYDLQPVTALVFVCAPIPKKVDFEFEGIEDATEETLKEIRNAINAVFFDIDALDGTGSVLLSELNYAISNVAGATGYIMSKPNGNIQLGVGELPVIGEFPEVTNE